MNKSIVALFSGLIFGFGLALGGMLNPSKVVGFLNIFEVWDPSLACVMIGGILVNGIGNYFFIKKAEAKKSSTYKIFENGVIDKPLIIGSALFGIGWGVSGLCPGPVVASLGMTPISMIPFILILMLGLWCGGKLKFVMK